MITTDDGLEAALERIVQADEEESLEETIEATSEEDSEIAEDDATPEMEASEEADESADDVDQDDEAGHDEPSVFTVKVDGRDVEVTLDDLKRGYSGQQYIQKGMQENAQVRKQLESQLAQLQEAQNHVVELYKKAQNNQFPKPPSPPSKELFDSDPIGYMEAKIQYDEAKENYEKEIQQYQRLEAQTKQQQEQAKAQRIQQEVAMLLEKVPSLKDGDNAQKAVQKFVETGNYYGFSPEEVNSVVDHRAMMMLHDLAKYRELLNSKEQTQAKKVQHQPLKPKAAKPKSNKSDFEKNRNKLKRTGSIDDALSLILQ